MKKDVEVATLKVIAALRKGPRAEKETAPTGVRAHKLAEQLEAQGYEGDTCHAAMLELLQRGDVIAVAKRTMTDGRRKGRHDTRLTPELFPVSYRFGRNGFHVGARDARAQYTDVRFYLPDSLPQRVKDVLDEAA